MRAVTLLLFLCNRQWPKWLVIIPIGIEGGRLAFLGKVENTNLGAVAHQIDPAYFNSVDR